MASDANTGAIVDIESCPSNTVDGGGTSNTADPPRQPQPDADAAGAAANQQQDKRRVKLRSEVWQWFTKKPPAAEGKRSEFCLCNFCHKTFSVPASGGTSHLSRHITKGRCPYYSKEKAQQTQLCLQSSNSVANPGGVVQWRFDQERSRRELTELIIWRELPFNFVEDYKFRKYVRNLVPHYKFTSRNTTKEDCIKRYEEEKAILLRFFREHGGRVCLTTDTWTSRNELPFMAITAHFIDDEWRLHKRIINFVLTPIKSSGQNLAELLSNCLDSWDIHQIGTITMDNHTANDVLVRSFVEMYECRNDSLIQGGDYLQVRCWAHVINLIVQDGLEELKDCISRVRQAVKYVKASPKRKLEFLKYADQERIPRSKMLVLDVCTRWNSTYKMLGSALHYRLAYNRMKIRDINFKDPPTHEDWERAIKVHEFLGVFFRVTELFSGVRYCTAHMFFAEVYRLLMILRETSKSADPILRCTCCKMLLKFEKYWIEKPPNMLLSIAVVLDPRYKLKYMKFCYSRIYSSAEVVGKLKALESALHSLFNEYLQKYEASCALATTMLEHSDKRPKLDVEGSSSSTLNNRSQDLMDFHSFIEEEDDMVSKTELNVYLEEKLHRITENCEVDNFDILAWWKLNASKYPVLSKMAKDILAIPVSSVASESAFSTGGRVLSHFRSSLLPSTVEALICAQDWIREGELSYDDDDLEVDAAFQDLTLKDAMAKSSGNAHLK